MPTAHPGGGVAVAKGEKFFEERSDQSEVKARIIEKYFSAWSNIVLGAAQTMGSGKIGYIDLYAGPGRYKDGAASTPLLVLQKVIDTPKLHDAFLAFFNDGSSDHSETLQDEIDNLPGIEKLKDKPEVSNRPVDDYFHEFFAKTSIIPSFTFFDPFGYKGLSLQFLQDVVKDWGCDCVFFFNYGRINAGLENPAVKKHMDALFGKERAEELREKLEGKTPDQREVLILEYISLALRHGKKRYVLPFRFKKGNRTSHYLIFVTKHFKGFEVMKEIMAKESSTQDGGVASFAYSPADKDTPYLLSFLQPVEQLKKKLLKHFAGRTATMKEIYVEFEHTETTPFIKKNYKAALTELYEADKISAQDHKKGTFADHLQATFPTKK
jgi:three-Cys-motif partner protein